MSGFRGVELGGIMGAEGLLAVVAYEGLGCCGGVGNLGGGGGGVLGLKVFDWGVGALF